MQALPEKFKDWTSVPIYMPAQADHFSHDMNKLWYWCNNNCKNRFDSLFKKQNGYRIWIFESGEDASFFSLVWKK